MDISKCKTCEHYDSFFGSCKLYYTEVYFDSEFTDIRSVKIKEIDETECEYEPKKRARINYKKEIS